MILDLVGFISTHFQPKPSHGDPFQANFSEISNSDFWINLEMSHGNPFFDFFVDTLRGVDPSKKMRLVRTIHFHPFLAESSVMRQKTCFSVFGNDSSPRDPKQGEKKENR